jgi:hypothetical protein
MGIPESVWGSPYQNGDARGKNPHIGLGIPESVRGSPNQNGDPRISIPKRGSPNQYGDENPNRFGDPHTKTGIPESPYQNGDPRTNMGIVQSLTHTNMGFIPIWGPTELIPNLERHSKWGPHIGMGIPISVWAGICQYSKSGSPHTDMGFIPIWGPTYIYFCSCTIYSPTKFFIF